MKSIVWSLRENLVPSIEDSSVGDLRSEADHIGDLIKLLSPWYHVEKQWSMLWETSFSQEDTFLCACCACK